MEAEQEGSGAIPAPSGLTGRSYAADRTLELPMTLISRTVRRTAQAISALQPGQVLAVHTDDP